MTKEEDRERERERENCRRERVKTSHSPEVNKAGARQPEGRDEASGAACTSNNNN